MRRSRWRRRVVIGGLGLLALVTCAAGTLAIALYYPRLGRISDFVVPPTYPYALPETEYILELVDGDVVLRHGVSQASLVVDYNYYPYIPTGYKLLRYQDKLYLLTRQISGGSGSGMWFTVYNITGNQPDNLMRDSAADAGLSCTYPRLEGDTLQFEVANYCDLFPWAAGGSFRTYRVVLE